jgi:hypothetical protein
MKSRFLFAAVSMAVSFTSAHAQSDSCPAARQVVDIRSTTHPAIMRSHAHPNSTAKKTSGRPYVRFWMEAELARPL